MTLNTIPHAIEWLEHRSKPLFVIVALGLYAWSLIQLAGDVHPVAQLDEFLVQALANLSIPFGVILLQELLELIATIPDSNLLSARRQFEIVVLVIVRSFFKKFAKVSGYVADGEFSSSVQEAVIKIVAIIVLVFLIYMFRKMASSDALKPYKAGQKTNVYKQMLVLALTVFVLINMIFIQGAFDEIEFIRQIFTGIIIIDALFLILAIMGHSEFLVLTFESSLIIALIFARFPLFTSTSLAYILSVLGVAFATGTLYLMYRVAQVAPEEVAAHDETLEEMMAH